MKNLGFAFVLSSMKLCCEKIEGHFKKSSRAKNPWVRLSEWVLGKNLNEWSSGSFISTVFRFQCYYDIFAFNLEKVTSV
jgi:hypothetical protein